MQDTKPEPILIGMCTSPFVRRVAIALELYEIPYTHERWSVWRDAERIAAYNPLRRVPALVWPTGEVLVDSHVILDALDDSMPPERALLARSGNERRAGLRICGLACGAADKAVSLLYEKVLRPEHERSAGWVERCSRQLRDTLAQLDRERAGAESQPFWLSERLSHADIAVAVAWSFIEQAHPDFLCDGYPALRALVERVQAEPTVSSTYEPLQVRPGAGFGAP